MEEVRIVVRNGLWILGLAIVLATWSYARFAAYEAHIKTNEKLNELKYVVVINVGLVLFVSGMVATEDRLLARLLWLGLGAIVVVHTVLRVMASRAPDAKA